MNDVWFQALFASPPVICGVRLRPYSLGHEMLLHRLGNPFVTGGERTAQALMTAVLVCSRTTAENRERTLRPTVRDVARLWWWGRRWRRRMDLPTAVDSFGQYIADHSEVPEHKVAEKQDSAPHLAAAPVPWHIVRCLCSEYGMLPEQAWDCPKALAVCYWDVWRESQGDETLASEDELKVSEMVQRGRESMAHGRTAEADAWFRAAQGFADLRSGRRV